MKSLLIFTFILNACSYPPTISESERKVFQGTCDSVCITVEAPKKFKGNTFQTIYKFTNVSNEPKVITMRGCSLNPSPKITSESGSSIEEDVPGCVEYNTLENIKLEPNETSELTYEFVLKSLAKGDITVETKFIDNSKFSWEKFLEKDYDDMVIGSVIFHTKGY